MKVTIKWLKDYVNITRPAAEIAERLTMAGAEVKAVQVIGGKWDNVVIGQITNVQPHPNADRLTLPTVDLGTENQTVVCGAPNVRVGDKVAFARVGAELLDGHTGQLVRLKPAKIRGVQSAGMVCSEKELGISDNHQGILVLPPDAPVGMPLADYLGDTIIDLDVTPNRPDCLSVIGIAREVAALTGEKVSLPEATYEEVPPAIEQMVSVEIADTNLCPRYCASLITGVKIGESPKWLQQRLEACGMRPINNVVDVTNYVMLEHGQPLHAFDYERIRGKKIIVRRAREGEVIVSLDGAERKLSASMLVIADESRAVAVAGIMGGANSEVTEGTTSILLESANFKPTSVHYTGRQLGMPSEACMRFERGIRPEITVPALRRATQLIAQLAGGKAVQGIIDVYPGRRERNPILLSIEKVNKVLGTDITYEQVRDTLQSLGIDCQPGGTAGELTASAPYWRSDIALPVDLVEEVARIIGYDKIPTTMLSQPVPRHNPEPIVGLKRSLRERLLGYGFQEVITYSLVGSDMLTKLSPQADATGPRPLRVANPMTAELEYLRPSLRGNLLSILSSNRRHEDGGIRLFELGRVYVPRPKDLPDEPEMLCGLISGPRKDQKVWQGDARAPDFLDAKGIVEGLLGHFGLGASFEPSADPNLHPAKQASIVVGGENLGLVGEVHPKVAVAFELGEAPYLFEINVAGLTPLTTRNRTYQPVPRFPSTVRDVALVVDAEVTHRQVVDTIKGFPLVVDVNLFDVYAGEQVPPGKKSLAYRITYRSPERTLTDEEVDQTHQQIVAKLAQQLGATLRT